MELRGCGSESWSRGCGKAELLRMGPGAAAIRGQVEDRRRLPRWRMPRPRSKPRNFCSGPPREPPFGLPKKALHQIEPLIRNLEEVSNPGLHQVVASQIIDLENRLGCASPGAGRHVPPDDETLKAQQFVFGQRQVHRFVAEREGEVGGQGVGLAIAWCQDGPASLGTETLCTCDD